MVECRSLADLSNIISVQSKCKSFKSLKAVCFVMSANIPKNKNTSHSSKTKYSEIFTTLY